MKKRPRGVMKPAESKLRLRVDKYVESDGGEPPEVFANIYSLDPSSGSSTKQTVRREMVPISNDVQR